MRYTLAPPLDSRSAVKASSLASSRVGRPGHDDGQVGLDEHVVDRVRERRGEDLLSDRPASRSRSVRL